MQKTPKSDPLYAYVSLLETEQHDYPRLTLSDRIALYSLVILFVIGVLFGLSFVGWCIWLWWT
jgi:hypothetical protein